MYEVVALKELILMETLVVCYGLPRFAALCRAAYPIVILASLLSSHTALAAIVTTSSVGVQARATSSYQGTEPNKLSYVDEDANSDEDVTTVEVTTLGLSASGLASSRYTTNSGSLTVKSSYSAATVPDYYLQGYATATASASINSPTTIRTFHAGRGNVAFNVSSQDLLSVNANVGAIGTPGSQRSYGVIVWAEDGYSFPGVDPYSARDPEQGGEPAEVAGSDSGFPVRQRNFAPASSLDSPSTPLENFGNFNHFLTPVEENYGRTAPLYFAREWSVSPEYLFSAPNNLITSVLLPNATQGGDVSFELLFGDYANPTTTNFMAGETVSDFGSLYPDGISWFAIRDVFTDLDAPRLAPFVLGVTFAEDGLGELRSWELASVPEPSGLFPIVLASLGLVVRRRTTRDSELAP